MKIRISELLAEHPDDTVVIADTDRPAAKRIKEAVMSKIQSGQSNENPDVIPEIHHTDSPAPEPVFTKRRRIVRWVLLAAALVVVLTVSALAIRAWVRSAQNAKDAWTAAAGTEMSDAQSAAVDDMSANVTASATGSGFTVAVDSVTCGTDTVTVVYTIQALDGAAYTGGPGPVFVTALWQSDTWGEGNLSAGNGGDSSWENGVLYCTTTYTYDDLAQGQSLGDGTTTIRITVTQLWLRAEGSDDLTTVEGSWELTFALPEASAAQAIYVTDPITLGNLTITDLKLTENNCSFSVNFSASVIDDTQYAFVGSDTLELARAAGGEGDVFCALTAVLQDGTQLPSDGSSGSYDDETGLERWTIRWVSPIVLSDADHLSFTDGVSTVDVALFTAG